MSGTGGPGGSPHDLSGTDSLTEHARWIIAVHTARSDGLQQRAMGFLGVVGVMLGLVLTSLTIGAAPRHLPVQIFTVLTVVALVAASVEFVRCLWLARVTVPSVESARATWRDHAAASVSSNRVRVFVANELLGGAAGTAGPLADARNEADARARRLKSGLRALVMAFVFQAALIIAIVFNHGGR